jgi:hypothetical protein
MDSFGGSAPRPLAAKEKVSLPDASLFIIEGEIYFDKNEVFKKLIKKRILPIPKKTFTKTQVADILGPYNKFEPQYTYNGCEFYDQIALEKHLIDEFGETEDQAREKINAYLENAREER